MVSKILILAGAPDRDSLDWDTGGLLSGFQDSIAEFVGIDALHGPPRPTAPTLSLAPDHAVWRSLSLDRKTVPAGLSQSQNGLDFYHGPDEPNLDSSPQFLTTMTLSFASEGDDGDHGDSLSQFYEHSLAVHEDITSSQLISKSTAQDVSSFLSDGTSSFVSTKPSQPAGAAVKAPLVFRGSDVLTSLKTLPSAAYLVKIQPSTMTCNLIVGVISISQPRAIKTRWGATKYLVEVLVGDETKAGFAVTYWLASANVEDSPLAGMRPRDILLLQNVALNAFANKVYGASLRKDLTKVHLLYRTRLDADDTRGYYGTSDLSSTTDIHPQLEKTRRVRDWVSNFVGGGTHDRGKADSGPRWHRPPADDTQLA
ncbi:hypothetical protein C8A05DRAFT_12956 [Staphylotrichum tortipilum]|uniref:Nucleic acid-binding, OB-fold protein n=1 Tax=Staphylotrichum tortipilum TaxID=2831512 RepID=A0AAN6RWC6_9PEZI|nr:hypothetical protein C8A05DRAFT_12956 [Staphylotrichum longicolle]